jgi:hypothetical protein
MLWHEIFAIPSYGPGFIFQDLRCLMDPVQYGVILITGMDIALYLADLCNQVPKPHNFTISY